MIFDTLPRRDALQLLRDYSKREIDSLSLTDRDTVSRYDTWLAAQPGETMQDVREAAREAQGTHEHKRRFWEIATGVAVVGALCALPFGGHAVLPFAGAALASTGMHVYHSRERDRCGEMFAISSHIARADHLLGGAEPPLCKPVILAPPPQELTWVI